MQKNQAETLLVVLCSDEHGSASRCCDYGAAGAVESFPVMSFQANADVKVWYVRFVVLRTDTEIYTLCVPVHFSSYCVAFPLLSPSISKPKAWNYSL